MMALVCIIQITRTLAFSARTFALGTVRGFAQYGVSSRQRQSAQLIDGIDQAAGRARLRLRVTCIVHVFEPHICEPHSQFVGSPRPTHDILATVDDPSWNAPDAVRVAQQIGQASLGFTGGRRPCTDRCT